MIWRCQIIFNIQYALLLHDVLHHLVAVFWAVEWLQGWVLAKQAMHLQQFLSFFFLLAIAKPQLDHYVALILPGAWVDLHICAGKLDNLFLRLVFDHQGVNLAEKWLHKLVCKIPGDNLLPLLRHGRELLHQGGTVLL